MIPAAFEYVRAGSAEEAISLIAEHGDEAKFLAGGHSLVPLMKLRLAQPSVLIDIGRVSDLSYVKDAGDHIAVGALTRHCDVENSPIVMEHAPLLAHATSHVGDPQVRHRGTIGGSLAHADPASDLPATTLALGATYVVQGPNGTREIPAGSFYEGYLTSVLAADEMLTEIRVPKMNGAGWSFQKFNRRAQDWAIVGVAAGATALTQVSPLSTWHQCRCSPPAWVQQSPPAPRLKMLPSRLRPRLTLKPISTHRLNIVSISLVFSPGVPLKRPLRSRPTCHTLSVGE